MGDLERTGTVGGDWYYSKNCCVICPPSHVSLFPFFPSRYHDIDSVADFLVLDSLYKTSVYTQWQEGDKFRSHIKKKFWFGTVKKKWAFRWVFNNIPKPIHPMATKK